MTVQDIIHSKKHLGRKNYCQGCGLDNSKFKVFNKYFEDSYLKSLFVIIYGKNILKLLRTQI